MKYLLLSIVMVLSLSFLGCSQKEFTEGANGIGNDISKEVKRITKVRE